MTIRYVHTNIIARDWKKLAAFYCEVFGCEQVGPERDMSGDWLSRGTAVADAHLYGVHLRLPGHGERGPTLEIFSYDNGIDAPPAGANRRGFGHLAFAVDDVETMANAMVQHGGKMVAEIVKNVVPGAGTLTFVYVEDPEGNLVELQRWD